jgi:tRNA (guanine37-N1)-methyltransferase
MNLKEMLKDKLSEEELKLVPSSFDVIGSREKAVAIVEIAEELKSKERIIAEVIMQMEKNVKSVLKKSSERRGKFRTREYELIAGDENTEVVHREYGYLIKLDPQKAYFSSREATERQRITKQVKEKEVVMLMFAGVGPIGIAIAKKQPNVGKIIAVESNIDAVRYMRENVRINKVAHLIVPALGNVESVCQKYFGLCDRVIMPLPIGAEKFLGVAIKCLKEVGGIIHFYSLGVEEDLYSGTVKVIEENAKKLGRGAEILEKRKVSAYSPSKWKVCIDCLIK